MKIQSCFALGLAWLSLAPCALSQRAGQDPNALVKFQNALKHDGFDVSTGAPAVLNLVAGWCAGTPLPGFDHALYANNQPYLQLLVPKSAQDSRLTIGPTTVLGLFVRMYLEPATKVAPVMPEILYDRIIKFSPRQPGQP